MTEAADDTAADRRTADADGERAKRGAGFPTMDLASAIEVIHTVGGYGADFTPAAFAQYCGHQTANSGPFKTKLAAFRDWSLAVKKGGRVHLTDLGQEVARSPEPMVDAALLRRVFDACSIFKGFFDDQAKGVPIKTETLGRAAVFDLKIAPKSQERFVKTLVDSAATVGLATRDDAGTVTFAASGPVGGEEPARPEPEATPASPVVQAAPARPAAQPVHASPAPQASPVASSAAPVLLRQVWPTATGEVVLAIHSTEPLPASAFSLVGTVVQAAEELAGSIGLSAAAEEPAEPEDDDAA